MPKSSGEGTGHNRGSILINPRKIMEINPEVQGSVLLSNTYSAARNLIGRIGEITGRDTEGLESTIVEGLDARSLDSDTKENSETKKPFATEAGDMIIKCGVDAMLDEALDKEFQRPGWSASDTGNIAIAVTHGDDPWILRQSPLPSPSSLDWPEQKEVEEWLRTGRDGTNVLNRLKLLALGDDPGEGQTVLGSYLRLFTSHNDCEVWYWLRSKAQEISQQEERCSVRVAGASSSSWPIDTSPVWRIVRLWPYSRVLPSPFPSALWK